MTSGTATRYDDALAEEVIHIDFTTSGYTHTSKLSQPLCCVMTPSGTVAVGTSSYVPYVTISGRTLTFAYDVATGANHKTFYCIIKGRL